MNEYTKDSSVLDACDEIGPDLLAFHRDELDAAAAARVATHLESGCCQLCQQAMREMQALDRLFWQEGLEARPPSPMLLSRLRESISEHSTQQRATEKRSAPIVPLRISRRDPGGNGHRPQLEG